ncbi:MAG: hypothetical protein ACREFC_04445, partial [Stellaceae bacterium]
PLSFDDFLAGSDAYDRFNFGMLKPMVRTDFIRRMSLLYDARARHGQDFLYLLKFFAAGGTAAIADAPLYYYTQPFGAASRQWSHPARRRYDFKAAHENNRRYLETMRDCLTQGQADRLHRRVARLKTLEYYDCAKERLLAGNVMDSLLFASRRPSVVGYALRRSGPRLVPRTGTINAIDRIAAQARDGLAKMDTVAKSSEDEFNRAQLRVPLGVTVVVLNDFCYVQGGGSRVAIDEAVGLAEAGADVIFIGAVGPPCEELLRAPLTVECLGQGELRDVAKHPSVALQGLWNGEAGRRTRLILRSLPRERTIVHLHGYTKALTASPVRAAHRLGIPVVCT